MSNDPSFLNAVARADNFKPLPTPPWSDSTGWNQDAHSKFLWSPADAPLPCVPFHLTREDYETGGIAPLGWIRPRVCDYLRKAHGPESSTSDSSWLLSPVWQEQGHRTDSNEWSLSYTNGSVLVAVTLHEDLAATDPDTVTKALAGLTKQMKDEGVFSECLDGWRNELYEIYGDPKSSYFTTGGGRHQPQDVVKGNFAFALERAACAIFGLATFGVHMTAYEGDGEDVKIWVPRRSATKATWPSKLDNSVAGGIPAGMRPFECMIKECDEEASLEQNVVRRYIQAAGVTTYFYITSEGWLQPEVEYIYDLHLPVGTVLKPKDDEVESFRLMPVADVLKILRNDPEQFKPNCGLILVDFFVRQGFITVENEPQFVEIANRTHRHLDQVPMPVREFRAATPRTDSAGKPARQDRGRAGVLSTILHSTMLLVTMLCVAIACCIPLASAATSDGHTNNWAVLVCSSRYWFNYRHMANTLGMYRTVKRLGIPDSHIILMLADDVACDARNEFPAAVYANSGRQLDLYGSGVDDAQGKGGNGIGVGVEVDYRGYEVNVENFLRVLTGRTPPELPPSKHLLSDASSNVFVYLTGHGGNEFLKFQDNEEVSAHDLGDAIAQMWGRKRYNRMLLMVDTCQANTLYGEIRSPNVIATGSSGLGENSYSHHNDRDIGVAVIDSYTHYVLQYLEQVGQSSQVTMQQFFDNYDPAKIKSHPGIRTDLFPFNLTETLVTDFFGGVSDVEKLKVVDQAGENSPIERHTTGKLERSLPIPAPTARVVEAFEGNLELGELSSASGHALTAGLTIALGASAWFLKRKR